jgi:hypothetical protein
MKVILPGTCRVGDSKYLKSCFIQISVVGRIGCGLDGLVRRGERRGAEGALSTRQTRFARFTRGHDVRGKGELYVMSSEVYRLVRLRRKHTSPSGIGFVRVYGHSQESILETLHRAPNGLKPKATKPKRFPVVFWCAFAGPGFAQISGCSLRIETRDTPRTDCRELVSSVLPPAVRVRPTNPSSVRASSVK